MGLCVSSASKNSIKSEAKTVSDMIKRPPTITVIHVDGRVEELNQAVKAKSMVTQNPDCFLCSSESMSIGTCPPRVLDEEDLQVGQIYFLLPKSRANEPLSLQDLCGLAIKASSAIAKHGFDISSVEPKIVFR